MRNFRPPSILLSVLLLLSCGKDIPALEGIDGKVWKADRNGCNKRRAAMKSALSREKEKLLALDEMQIVELLGRPDRNELFKRNQKFYYYYLDPSGACGVPDDHAQKLIIRFNATGLAKVVLIE